METFFVVIFFIGLIAAAIRSYGAKDGTDGYSGNDDEFHDEFNDFE